MNLDPSTQQTIIVGVLGTLILIPVCGFLLKWMLSSVERRIDEKDAGQQKRLDAIASDIRSVAASVSSHETRLALVEQKAARGEADIQSLRDSKHDLSNEVQGMKFRLAALERTHTGEHRKAGSEG
jgi:predicted  nucleic acid-binding Zn-ribbon protein